MKQSQHVAYGGVLTALSLVILLLASIIPASGWGLSMAAGMIPAIALVRGRMRTGLMVYLSTVLMGILLIPAKRYVAAYALLFGIYPLIKYWIERIRFLPLEWVCKLLYAGVLSLVLFRLFRYGIISPDERIVDLPRLPVWCGFFFVFACYDILFSKIIALFRIFPLEDHHNKAKKG